MPVHSWHNKTFVIPGLRTGDPECFKMNDLEKIDGGVAAALGYRAAGVAAQIKYANRKDFALVVSDDVDELFRGLHPTQGAETMRPTPKSGWVEITVYNGLDHHSVRLSRRTLSRIHAGKLVRLGGRHRACADRLR